MILNVFSHVPVLTCLFPPASRHVPQREFDENEVDPFHGKQDKKPEPEAMDLPEELNLDQQDGDDDEEGDGEDDLAFSHSV